MLKKMVTLGAVVMTYGIPQELKEHIEKAMHTVERLTVKDFADTRGGQELI